MIYTARLFYFICQKRFKINFSCCFTQTKLPLKSTGLNDIIHWICIEPTSTFSIRVQNCNFSPHYSEIERFTLWIYFPLNFIFGLGCVSVGFCITAKSLLISNFVRFMPNNKHQIQTMEWKYLNMPLTLNHWTFRGNR